MDSRRLLQDKGDEILRLHDQLMERDKIIEVIFIFLVCNSMTYLILGERQNYFKPFQEMNLLVQKFVHILHLNQWICLLVSCPKDNIDNWYLFSLWFCWLNFVLGTKCIDLDFDEILCTLIMNYRDIKWLSEVISIVVCI